MDDAPVAMVSGEADTPCATTKPTIPEPSVKVPEQHLGSGMRFESCELDVHYLAPRLRYT